MINGQYVVLALYEVHMASACIMIDGQIIAATHEERFSRLKNDCGFPLRAAQFCLQAAKVDAAQVDVVALVNTKFSPESVANILFKRMAIFSQEDWIEENKIYWHTKLVKKKDPGNYFDIMSGWDRVQPAHYYDLSKLDFSKPGEEVTRTFNEIRKLAVEKLLGITREKIAFLPHFMCHHYHAYYSSEFRGDDVVVLHVEGSGETYNQAISLPSKTGLKLLSGTNQCDLGRLYQWITLLLGMKPYHHEYKVMGLAPHATSHEIERSYRIFESIFTVNEEKLLIEYSNKPADLFFHFQDKLQGHRFDGIAGALQKVLEQNITRWVQRVIDYTGRHSVVYGGGVAMNVKANMKIAALNNVLNFAVPLSPADESNVFGAAYWMTEKHYVATGRNPQDIPPLMTAYLGPDYNRAEVQQAIKELEQQFSLNENIDDAHIAGLLQQGKIVARFQQRSEFGQRALGNRSILAHPGLPGAVARINRQIKYRDFWMPFAPTVMEESANKYIVNPKKHQSPYMTMTFEATRAGSEKMNNGLHPADATTRPQILSKKHNYRYYNLIEQFQPLSGVGALLNTSFNLHGEPIVETPADAVNVFRRCDIDALWIDEYLISRDNREDQVEE